MTNSSLLEKQVLTDDLTGLYNRRYLNQRLEEETELSLRGEVTESFSLIMLDLDHFKEVNDQYGHDEGDQALIWISNILKSSVRSGDIVIRFAGDEFFLILPGASISDAEKVAERIYGNISKNPFTGSKQQVDVPLGISGGIAMFPDDASTVEDLMKSADNGLYLAKEQGRGVICLASDAKKIKERKFDRDQLINPPFAGRKREIKELRTCAGLVKSESSSRFVFTQGESGMGKSRLVREFYKDLPKGQWLLLSAFCRSNDVKIPYQVLMDLLGNWYNQGSELFLEIYNELSAPERVELQKLVPSLAEGNDVGIGDFSSQDSSSLYYGVANFFVKLAAKQPLIIVIEDLHLIDTASADLLHHITSQTVDCQVFFITNSEPVHGESKMKRTMGQLLRKIRRETDYLDLPLLPMEERDVRDFIRLIFRPENPFELFGIEKILCKEAEGNPLFMKELLLKFLNEEILSLTPEGWRFDDQRSFSMPEMMKDVITDRIETLDEELLNLLQVASIMGREFFLDILMVITRKNEGYLLDLLDEGLQAGVIEELPRAKVETYRFVSHNVQKFLYGSSSHTRRRRYHQQVMDAFIELFGSEIDEKVEYLFEHAFKGKRDFESFEYGIKSAQKSMRSYGINEAVQFFEKSFDAYYNLSDSEQEDLKDSFVSGRSHYGRALIFQGRYQEAKKVFKALPSSPEKSEQLGMIHFRVGEYAEAANLLNGTLGQGLTPSFESKIHSLLSEVYHRKGDYDMAISEGEKALELAKKDGDLDKEGNAMKVLGSAWLNVSQSARALSYYRNALKKFKAAKDFPGIGSCFNNIGLVHYLHRKYESAERWFLQAKKVCSEIGHESLSMHVLNNLGNVYYALNQIKSAESAYSRCLTLSEDHGEATVTIASCLNLGNVLREESPGRSEAFYLKGLELCQKVGEFSKEAFFYQMMADLSRSRNLYEQSEEYLLKAYEIRNRLGEIETEIFTRIKLAELYYLWEKADRLTALCQEIDSFFKENSEGPSNRIRTFMEEWEKWKVEKKIEA